jgi:hypothetical protein
MNKRKSLILSAALAILAGAGCVSTHETEIFGKQVGVIVTRGLFEPSTTTVIDSDLRPINAASNPGLVTAAAGGTGTAVHGALRRPDRINSSTAVSVDGGATTVNGGNTSSEGGPGFVPPGHQNNPSPNN